MQVIAVNAWCASILIIVSQVWFIELYTVFSSLFCFLPLSLLALSTSPSAVGHRDHWQNDDTVDKCTACQTSFGMMERKHHCRDCGKIFCYK